MLKIRIIPALAILSLLCITNCKDKKAPDWKMEDGYISNDVSAIKIAEIVWINVYGSEIEGYKPFKAKLKDGQIWIIEGTLDKDKVGGVPYMEIQKSDGKILKVIHGK